MTVLLVVLGFVALAGLFVYLTVLGAAGWRKKMEAVLLPVGFQACTSDAEKASIAQRLTIVNPRRQGKRLVMHLYRRASPAGDYTVFVCDYAFASASGKARGSNWMLVCLMSNALNLPRLAIEGAPTQSDKAAKLFGALSKTIAMPGMERIVTGSPDLDQRFNIYVDSAQVHPPLSHKLLAQLKQTPGGTGLDMRGDILVLTSIDMMADRVRQVLDPQKLLGQIHLATLFYQALKPGD